MEKETPSETLSKVLGRLSVSHYLIDLPHHVPPCHNLHSDVQVDEDEPVADVTHLFKQFPYTCSLPVPISLPSKIPRTVQNGNDPATKLIVEKIRWEKIKRKLVTSNKKDIKHINDNFLQATGETKKTILMSRGVALLADHLQSDPDSRFSGSYNWYYSGGNMAIFCYVDKKYELSSSALQPGVLSVGELSQKEHTLEANFLESFTIDKNRNEPILQIVPGKAGVVATRQKNQINLLRANEEDEKIKFKSVHSVDSKEILNEGFVSVDLGSEEGEFCVVSNCGIIRLYQLQTSQKCVCSVKIQPGDGVKVSDRWASVQYCDPNLLLLTDRCCIHLLDRRCGLEETQLAWCPKTKCELCEEISVSVPSSVSNNVMYVGTSHQVFSLDIRFGFNQRWTHMMPNPPYIGSVATINDSCEIVFLGGQSQESVTSIINTWQDQDQSNSCNLPFVLSSPMETLRTGRSQGLYLNPSLPSRWNLSLTGLTNVVKEQDIFVLRSSSIGDIFYQHLQDKKRNNIIQQSFPHWDVVSEAEPVRVTSTADYSDIFDAINNWSSSSVSCPEYNVQPTENHWRVSKAFLEECVDMLAAPMLSVWHVEDEPEWDTSVIEAEKEDSTDKVLNWLDNRPKVIKSSPMKLAEPLPGIKIENIVEADLLDTTHPNNFQLSQIPLRPSSPAISINSEDSLFCTPARKRVCLTQSTTDKGKLSQKVKSQTPKKKFVSGF